MTDSADVVVVSCEDLPSYERAAASCPPWHVPVLAWRPELAAGYPATLTVVPLAAWDAPSHPCPPPDITDGVCVAVPDPTCAAVARYLAGATGRRVVVADEGDWERVLVEAVAGRPGSLTVVAPAWHRDTGQPSGTWVRRVLRLVRQQTDAPQLSWGLVTGTDPGVLSSVAAKAVLHRQIAAAYANAQCLLVAEWPAGALADCLPPVGRDGNDRFVLADPPSFRDGRLDAVLDRPLSLAVFRAHTRGYCGCLGYLCGARRADDDPAVQPATCVLGMECYSDQFPQVDPRRYNVPILVLDTCAAADSTSRVWGTGVPSLAFLALAGAPSAVLATDGAVVVSNEGYADALVAVGGATTMGDAARRLNAFRPRARGRLPYVLLGDPMIGAGPDRWQWASVVRPGEPAPPDDAGRSLIAQVEGLPPVDLGSVGFLGVAGGGGPAFLGTFVAPTGPEVWAGRRIGAGPLAVEFRCRSLPPHLELLRAEAVAAATAAAGWSEGLAEARAALVAAAQGVDAATLFMSAMRGRVVAADEATAQRAVFAAVRAWRRAHHDAIDAVLTLGRRGLWPSGLWPGKPDAGVEVDVPCPACGGSPTLRRSYVTGGGERRVWFECDVCCDLVEDRPDDPVAPRVEFVAPTGIAPGDVATAAVRVTHGGAAWDLVGSGAVLVDMDPDTHRVRSMPERFDFVIKPGGRVTKRVELHLPKPPAVAHLFRAKAVLLIHGRWFWSARWLEVRRA